jgi:hypothetical protein
MPIQRTKPQRTNPSSNLTPLAPTAQDDSGDIQLGLPAHGGRRSLLDAGSTPSLGGPPSQPPTDPSRLFAGMASASVPSSRHAMAPAAPVSPPPPVSSLSVQPSENATSEDAGRSPGARRTGLGARGFKLKFATNFIFGLRNDVSTFSPDPRRTFSRPAQIPAPRTASAVAAGQLAGGAGSGAAAPAQAAASTTAASALLQDSNLPGWSALIGVVDAALTASNKPLSDAQKGVVALALRQSISGGILQFLPTDKTVRERSEPVMQVLMNFNLKTAMSDGLCDANGGPAASLQSDAVKTLRRLAATDGIGAATAWALIDGNGDNPFSKSDLRLWAKAAAALDPQGDSDPKQLVAQARSIVDALPLASRSGSVPKPGEGLGDLWGSSIAAGLLALRIPALAMTALAAKAQSPEDELSVQQKVALAAMRNGITTEGPGTPLAFGDARIGKLQTWANRIENPSRADSLLHKTPLSQFVRSGSMGVNENVLRALRHNGRAASAGAGLLSSLIRKLGPVPQEQAEKLAGREGNNDFDHLASMAWDSETEESIEFELDSTKATSTKGDGKSSHASLQEQDLVKAFGTVALLEHWGKRPLLTQQLNAEIDPIELGAIVGNAATLAKREGDVAFVNNLKTWASPQKLDADALRQHHNFIDDLATKYFAEVDEPDPEILKNRASLNQLVDRAIGRPADVLMVSADNPIQWGEGATAEGRNAKEARKVDSLGALADAVGTFELGSSLTLTGGPKLTMRDPVGAAVGVAKFMLLLPPSVIASGGPTGSTAKKAVIKAEIGTAAAQIFVGTERNHIAQLVLGGGIGVGVTRPSLMQLRLRATLGVDRKSQTGVYLRLGRDGTVPNSESPGAPVPGGVAGDHHVAARMKALMLTAQAMSKNGEKNILLSLVAQFPELSISISQDPNEAKTKSNWESSVAGVVAVGYPNEGTQRSAPGVRLQGEWKPQKSAVFEPQGGALHSVVNQAGSSASATMSLGAGVTPMPNNGLEGSLTFLQKGTNASTTVLQKEGEHQAFNSYLTTSFETLNAFRQHVRADLGKWTEGSLAVDARAKELLARRSAGQPESVQATLREDALIKQAGKIEAYLNQSVAHSHNSYLAFCFMRPDVATQLDELTAIAQTTQDAPQAAALHEAAKLKYTELSGDPASYSKNFVMTMTQRNYQSEWALPIPISVSKERAIASNVIGDIA